MNCIKISGPLMSASEHQAARKAEFNEVVGDQLRLGLFKMKKVTRQVEGLLAKIDGQDRSESVLATEVVLDKDGRPIVMEESPLRQYGIEILQLSLLETDYDPETLKQFAAKKDAYLAAERAKAQQQEEISQRLMVIEKGKREVAEIEAVSNKLKMTATVKAQQEREVADIGRQKAVIEASKKVEVAGKELDEAIKRKSIAEVEAQTAELRKKATISLAEAKAKEIEIGGGLAEKDRILAEIKAKRDTDVALHLSKVGVPSVVLMGGQGDGKSGGGTLQENLINLWLLRSSGILDPAKLEGKNPPAPQK